MSLRKSTRTIQTIPEEIRNIFLSLENHYGELCYEEEKSLLKIRNALCRCIENYAGYRVIIKSIIKEALRFFDEQTSWFNELPVFENDTNPWLGLLSIVAHLCQKYDIRDESDLLRDIMMRMFVGDGGFMRLMNILDPLIFPHEVDRILYPVTVHEDAVLAASKNHLSILEYFLREAGHVVIELTYHEWDFLATIHRPPEWSYQRKEALINAPVPACRGSSPLLLACQSLNPSAVLLLLRYGAQPLLHHNHQRIMGWQFQHPLYHIIMKLNVAASWRQRNHSMDENIRQQFNYVHSIQVHKGFIILTLQEK